MEKQTLPTSKSTTPSITTIKNNSKTPFVWRILYPRLSETEVAKIINRCTQNNFLLLPGIITIIIAPGLWWQQQEQCQHPAALMSLDMDMELVRNDIPGKLISAKSCDRVWEADKTSVAGVCPRCDGLG